MRRDDRLTGRENAKTKEIDAVGPKKDKKAEVPKTGGWGFCNLPALLACVVMLLLIASNLLLSGNYINNTNPYAAVIIAQLCVFVVPCAFFTAFRRDRAGNALAAYHFRLFSPKMIGFVASCVPTLVFGGMLIKYLSYTYLNVRSPAAISAASSRDFLYVFLSTALIPALTEEMLLRGIIFTEYQKRVGTFGAIAGSALIFALIHFDVQNFFSYLYAGVILGIAVHATRSILAPMLLHLINNFLCIYADSFLQRIALERVSPVFVLFVLGVLLLLSLFAFCESLEWLCVYKADKLASHDTPEEGEVSRLLPPKGKTANVLCRVLLAPAFLAAVVIYILRIVRIG